MLIRIKKEGNAVTKSLGPFPTEYMIVDHKKMGRGIIKYEIKLKCSTYLIDYNIEQTSYQLSILVLQILIGKNLEGKSILKSF